MRPGNAIVSFLLLTGCFADEPTGAPCQAGSAGCACAKDETCLEGLSCETPGVCIDPNCAAGQLGCRCDAGMCDAGLVCNSAGGCTMPPGSTGSGDPTVGPTSQDPMTDASTMVSSESDDPPTSSSASTSGPDDGSTTTASTGADPVEACYAQNILDLPCGEKGCAADVDCDGLRGCVATCIPSDTACLDTCCAAHPTGANAAWSALLQCIHDTICFGDADFGELACQ